MRRSLGGGLMGTVHRVVAGGGGEPFSPSTANSTKKDPTNINKKTSNCGLTLNSPNGFGFSSVVSLPPVFPTTSTCSDSEDLEWEYMDDDDAGLCEDFVFGTVPSTDEVHHAVSALQQFLESSTNAGSPDENHAKDSSKDFGSELMAPGNINKSDSSVESDKDWCEPALHICTSNALQRRGPDRACDAFHLLQTEPSVQRMVISLSSDKAIWDAVLNNEVVRELRVSLQADEEIGERVVTEEGSYDDSNPVKNMMGWIVIKTREKIMHLIDKITKLVNEMLLQPPNEKRGGTSDPLEERLKTSLFLSIVVLLIVVVTRAQSA